MKFRRRYSKIQGSENLRYVWGLFPKQQQRVLKLLILVNIALSLLDLTGIILIGLLGSIATLNATNQEPGGLTKVFIDSLRLNQFEEIQQMTILGLGAGIFLISKTFLSFVAQKRLAFFLETRITSLISKFLRLTMSWRLEDWITISKSQMVQSVQHGIPALVSGVTLPAVVMISDFALIFILSSALLVAEPVLALATAALFGLTAIFLHFKMSVRQRKLGSELSKLTLKNHSRIEGLTDGYREAYVRSVRENLILEIESNRERAARILAEFAIVNQINKYAFEITMVFGAFLIVSQQLLVSNSSRAVAIVGVFIAASFRIGPAILRIQFSILSIRRAIAQSEFALDVLRKMKFEESTAPQIAIRRFPNAHETKVPAIRFNKVDFGYSSERPLISKFTFESKIGEHVAVVGTSGVGKTTLVDLLVGALKPTTGEIYLFGESPNVCIEKHAGLVSYLPQNALIFDGTIRQNVCFGYDTFEVPESKIWQALSSAKIENFVRSLPGGLEYVLTDRGTNVSGGQVQRLVLARALLTEPKLLILDEATSALDNKTQQEISAELRQLKGNTTILMIAHRLESIKFVDRVINIESPNSIQILERDTFLRKVKKVSK